MEKDSELASSTKKSYECRVSYQHGKSNGNRTVTIEAETGSVAASLAEVLVVQSDRSFTRVKCVSCHGKDTIKWSCRVAYKNSASNGHETVIIEADTQSLAIQLSVNEVERRHPTYTDIKCLSCKAT